MRDVVESELYPDEINKCAFPDLGAAPNPGAVHGPSTFPDPLCSGDTSASCDASSSSHSSSSSCCPSTCSSSTSSHSPTPHSYVTPTSGPLKLVGMAVRPFPRTNWHRIHFADPETPYWHPRQKTEWACRQASRRWAAAFDAGDLGNLDSIDFDVAVLDHVSQKNVGMQAQMSAHGWTLSTNIAIEFSFKAAEWRLREAFPRNPRVGGFLDRQRVFEFVRPALNWQWEGAAHGGGRDGDSGRPPLSAYGRNWVERYLPGYMPPVFDPAEMDEEVENVLRRFKSRGRSFNVAEDWMVRMGICMTRHRDMCDCYPIEGRS